MKSKVFLLLSFVLFFAACNHSDIDDVINSVPDEKVDTIAPEPEPEVITTENIIVANEGMWNADNGQLSLISDSVIYNNWFQTTNNMKLGDTPDDIIQCNDTLIAIAVNTSNIIEYIYPNGKHIAATEDIPNNRKLCTDGKYLYVTSYGHSCGNYTFTKGFVAKIDLKTKEVVACCEVGWEPEGIAFYDGKLYVANSGGYAFSEGHDYDSTLSIVDASTMTVTSTVDLGVINLYGPMSICGKYLCINSAGDYSQTPACSVIFDCETHQCEYFETPATYNTASKDKFYIVGSSYDMSTWMQNIKVWVIDPSTCFTGKDPVIEEASDDIKECLANMANPCAIYCSPLTGNIYLSDAGNYTDAGTVYRFTPDGKANGSWNAYISPAHLLAVKK